MVHLPVPSVTAHPQLLVAVILTSAQVPRWAAHLLGELDAMAGLSLASVVVCPGFEQAADPRPSTLFRCYEAFDRRLCSRREDGLETVESPPQLAVAGPVAGPSGEPESWEGFLDQVRGDALDVVVALCPPSAELLALAPCLRYGIWTICHGAEADPPGTWLAREVRTFAGAVETRLEMRVDSGGDAVVIANAFQAVDPVSLHRTRSAACWKGAHLVTRSLSRLRLGREPVTTTATDAQPRGGSSNLESARLLLTVLVRIARRRLRERLCWNQWFVAYRRREDSGGFERATVVASPQRRSLMDPCIVERDGEHLIFVEDFSVAAGRAAISYLRVDREGNCSGPFPALERDHHLSYPFVFEWQGEMYMIPETAAARTVGLYRAERFPDRWQLATSLLDNVAAFDATLCEHDERLWLFVSIAATGVSVEDELYVFYSDSLFGIWHEHPLNPVVSDVRRARPAGRLFLRDGQLIRPGQDSSRGYGGAVVFSRIDVLTENEYRETPIGRIERNWRPENLGSHCYTADSVYEVVDGRRRRFRRAPGLRELARSQGFLARLR